MDSATDREYLHELREALLAHFGESELRMLCFDLGIEYQDLPGAGITDRTRELVSYLYHRNRISRLIDACRQMRPDVHWSDVPVAGRPAQTTHVEHQAGGYAVQIGKAAGVTIEGEGVGAQVTIHGDVVAGRDIQVEFPQLITPVHLRRMLDENFSWEELRTLCFDINVDFDALPGAGKASKSRELVSYFWRRDQLELLVSTIDRLRPGLLEMSFPFWRAWRSISTNLGILDFAGFTRDAGVVAQGLAETMRLPLLPDTVSQGRMLCFWFDTSVAFSETMLPPRLPLLLLHRDRVLSSDLDDIQHILARSQHGQPRHIAMILLFCESESLERGRRLLSERLEETLAYDVITLGETDVQSLLLNTSPQEALRHLILSQVDLLSISPFVVNGPTPDNVFVGREHELRDIAERAVTASFALVGGRRIGKTSLLGRLHRVRLPAVGCRTLYHDCSTTPTYESFFTADIRDWRPKAPLDSPATLKELIRFPPSDKPLVLLLDEADKLIPADRANEWKVFNTLRDLANSGRAQIVLSGERTLREALQDPVSPLFNFANEILLGPLGFRAVEALVTRPMKQLALELVDEKEVVGRIWAFTSGHPNVVQRLCRRLIERLNAQGTRRITLDDVSAVIEDPKFQEVDFLQTYWEAASPLEKIVTLVLLQETKAYRLREVRQLLSDQASIQPSATAVKEALDRLVDLRSILKRSRAGYAFAVRAFPLVLANTTTVEDLLEVLVEQYEQTEA